MIFADHLTLDAPRRTQDGYLAVRAKAARVGVYQYSGAEVDPDNSHGLRDQAMVNVLRDADQVFDARSLGSFVGKPITDDHPTEGVNAGNWRDHARGVIMGAVKDGDHVGFDLAFLDGATIAKVDAGKVELSNGYSCKLEFGDFQAADGTKCAARQTNITGNHVALVDRGRAGASCRIGDAAICDSLPSNILDRTQEKPVKTMLIDGLTVDISNADTALATINTILAARDTATGKVTDLQTQVATLTSEKTTLDAKVTTLEQAVKDAKPTPAQLRDAGKALMIAAGKAKALGVAVTDAMDETAIMAATVTAKMGDAAKDWNDAQIAASFAVLTKDAKVTDTPTNNVQPIGTPVNLGDAATERQKALDSRRQHNSTAFSNRTSEAA
jgi:hypothetical protein